MPSVPPFAYLLHPPSSLQRPCRMECLQTSPSRSQARYRSPKSACSLGLVGRPSAQLEVRSSDRPGLGPLGLPMFEVENILKRPAAALQGRRLDVGGRMPDQDHAYGMKMLRNAQQSAHPILIPKPDKRRRETGVHGAEKQ